MTTTERIASQVARQREVLGEAAGAWTDRAAEALENIDVGATAGRAAQKAARKAGQLADETASGLRNVGPTPPAKKRRRLLKGLFALAAVAVGVIWVSSQG